MSPNNFGGSQHDPDYKPETTENNPAPEGLNVSDELTEAARNGAAGLKPAFANMTPKQQAKIVKALRKNNRQRLDSILEDYAHRLVSDDLEAILAEGTD